MYPRKSSSQIKPQKLATSLLGIVGVVTLIGIGIFSQQRQSTLEKSTLDKLNRLRTNNLPESDRPLETYSLPTVDTLAGERAQQGLAVAPIPLEAPMLPSRSASTPSGNNKFGGFSDSRPFTNPDKLNSSERKAANGFSPTIGRINKSSYKVDSNSSSTVSPGGFSTPAGSMSSPSNSGSTSNYSSPNR